MSIREPSRRDSKLVICEPTIVALSPKRRREVVRLLALILVDAAKYLPPTPSPLDDLADGLPLDAPDIGKPLDEESAGGTP